MSQEMKDIIRNEVYVGMSELNFPTKLIRLTKATKHHYCDVLRQNTLKIHNDCSESFDPTRFKTGRRIFSADPVFRPAMGNFPAG
jgi:hypothetical protein